MPRKRKTDEKENTKVREEELARDFPDELQELEQELASDYDEDEEEEEEEEASYDADEAPEAEAADVRERTAAASRDGERELEEEALEEYEEYEEEEEEVHGMPYRRETRQEMLGRLMHRLLSAREQVHRALEHVRDLNTQLRDAGSRPPEKLKDQYHKAIAELSGARREENFARADLVQMLNWRG
jgi:hypothetical protein